MKTLHAFTQFVVLLSLPLLLGGCGGDNNKPVAEKVLEVKEEAKTEAPVTQVKPEPEGVNLDKLEFREESEGIVYLRGSDAPYTGKAYELYPDGQKKQEGNFKNGKRDGLIVLWHENGQKMAESNYRNGNKIEGSEKFWNIKGEPVDTLQEAK
jgi:antitoxin component YwqK of YwqJK toxin-antitoxin module